MQLNKIMSDSTTLRKIASSLKLDNVSSKQAVSCEIDPVDDQQFDQLMQDSEADCIYQRLSQVFSDHLKIIFDFASAEYGLIPTYTAYLIKNSCVSIAHRLMLDKDVPKVVKVGNVQLDLSRDVTKRSVLPHGPCQQDQTKND